MKPHKLLVLLLIAVLAVPVIAHTSVAAQEVVTIEFWDNQQAESGLSQYQQTAVQEFEASHPNIKVDVVTVPYAEYQDRLTIAVRGGTPPDVSTVDQIWNYGFATGGAIIPLDDYIATSDTVKQANFFPGAWDSAAFEGKVWGVPFNVDVWQFTFYNKALLEAASVDPQMLTTWEGLKDAAAKLTDTSKGQYAVGLVGHLGEDTVVIMDSFIYSNGGSVLNADGTCALDQPEAVDALKYLVSLLPYAPEGVANMGTGDVRNLFLNGSLATEWWPALEQPTLQQSKLDWDFVVGTAPEGKTPVGTYGGWNLVIYDKSQHKDEAWQFIQFLTQPDVNGKVVDLIPANIEAATAFLNANRLHPDLILEHLNNARPRPLSPEYLQVSTIEQELAQAIFTGTSVDDAVKSACDQINALASGQ
jgi:ABC-type glycerol-3-phosphate transport system substrate-binding protein